ncbi:MAG: M48 family metalloprotease [Marinicella sp.]
MQAIKNHNLYLLHVLFGVLLLVQWPSVEAQDDSLIKDAQKQQQKLIDKYGLLEQAQWLRSCENMIQQLSLKYFQQCQILNVDYPNAYSLAHGVVMLTKGLLENIRNDDQLAHVLAHEHAHLALKHHQQAQAMVKNPPKLFTKSRIKKFYRGIEQAADDAADALLVRHHRDPKQIHHYLIRIAAQIKESSADHEKLKDRIQSKQLPAEKVEPHWTTSPKL